MNFHSPEWKETCDEIQKRVDALYVTLIGPLDFEKTCDVRGQIRALQSLKHWHPATEPEPEINHIR